ncbi:hypothetical protein [Sphaerimonospora thailandensis]|uniref:Uncharacterized protein n=1 Tax=Sphaerimonospora thailandensis TaxID=795644 RepID=A0A8J3R7U1_9ACTN|nr:hypothetical protein [Sphaerimonospora thailandensis]GIH69435.1 hypothetical protein Mth01_16880 [Sphaerimonospora thailandensis]
MPNLTDGAIVYGADFPPSAADGDDAGLTQLSNTSYQAGSPVVAVTFVAPTSGRVLLIVGGGMRDSAAVDQVMLAPQVFRGTDATGSEVLAPSASGRGLGSVAADKAFHYASRTSLLSGLTPGATYYARVVHMIVPPSGGTPSAKADIGARDITVIPVS